MQLNNTGNGNMRSGKNTIDFWPKRLVAFAEILKALAPLYKTTLRYLFSTAICTHFLKEYSLFCGSSWTIAEILKKLF
jgi:hypothetical protein